MVFPSVDNFLKIFRFYRLNSVQSVREINEYRYRYDSVDKYFEAFNYAYDSGETGLTYPEHKDEIEGALIARYDLTKYFNAAGFPGSYAFNTPDCFMMKTIVLDWASTIKTFQDSTAQCTNAYQLSSDDVDKAIRGFGIDFVNSRTVTSLNRRQTFLLNMCDLYKIKGSPASIIKALNIMGLDDIYISEAWIYPTRDGHQNVEIKWLPVEQEQTFDVETNQYSHETGLNTEYWSWGKFVTELDAINDPHWFYSKEEIVKINWKDSDTFIKLPSITPYFNINVKMDQDKNELGINKIQKIIQNQLAAYINGIDLPQEIAFQSYGKPIDILSCWNGFMYILALYGDFMRYYEFKQFMKKFIPIDYTFSTSSTKYLDLIYKVYTIINATESESLRTSFQNIMRLYVPSAVPNGYCSYNEVRYWWLNNKHTEDDVRNGLLNSKTVIKPTKCKPTANSGAYEVFWNEDYNYGYYDIEVFYDNDWHTVYSDQRVKCQAMQKIVYVQYDKKEIEFSDADDLRNKIRIVHYRTENNIPDVFFTKPFYFDDCERDTTMDTIYHLNDEAVHDIYYKNTLLWKLFGSDYKNICNNFNDVDLYRNLLDNIKNLGIRTTDKDTAYKTFMNSMLCYPNTLTVEDKDRYIDYVLHEYISKATHNYLDYVSHDGSDLRYVNLNYDFENQKTQQYPRNVRWNWAVSYGQTKSSTYFFYNYEGLKWCRIKGGELKKDDNISLNTSIFTNDFGLPVYKNGKVYIHVRRNNNTTDGGSWFVIDKDNCLYEDEWNALQYSSVKIPYTSQLYNDIESEYGIKTTIDDADGSKTVILPPSDIYPTSVLSEHKYDVKYEDSDGNISVKTYNFKFSDGMFKGDSKLARNVVVARVEPSIAETFYESVASCAMNNNYFSVTSSLQETLIDVYMDPFYTNENAKYSYDLLLKFLYKNGYTLDINTGYIYKPFNYYIDNETNYLYIKCIDNDPSTVNDTITYKWIRVKVSKEWDNNESRKSIYYQLDENGDYVYSGGKRIPIYNSGSFVPDLAYRNVYDAERFLSEPIIDGQDYSATNAEQEDGAYFHIKTENGFRCEVKTDGIGKESDIYTTYTPEEKLQSFDNNGNEVVTQLDSPLFNTVRLGINQDLKEYIDACITKQADSIESYEELILEFAQALQDYTATNIGFSIKFDVYSSHIFNSTFIQKIINFYKPKRARFLKLTSSAEANVDTVYDISLGDHNYNHVFLNDNDNKQEIGLHNRSLIKQEVNEYVPFNDLIYIKSDKFASEVNSFREVYPYSNVAIPEMQTYERIDHLDNYSVKIGNVVVKSCFYCTDFDSSVNGFYYKYDDEYFLNDYVFQKLSHEYNTKYDPDTGMLNPGGSYKKRTFTRWFLFKKLHQSLGLYNFEYVSEASVGNNPYQHANGTPLKYMKLEKRIQTDDEFMEYIWHSGHEYKYGTFQYYTDANMGYIKMNTQTLRPVFYIGNFEDSRCNGYYYTNGKSRFGYPIYFNHNGKMISAYDINTLPDRYIKYCIGEYDRDNCKCFWIVTDYKQIPDISEASHIAYNTDGSIFNQNDKNRTKTFYKMHQKLTSQDDLFFVSGVVGYSTDYVMLYPDCILDYTWERNRSKYVDNENSSYNLSVNPEYADIISRRVCQNTMPVLHKPKSNINFKFGYGLSDEYEKTQVLFKDKNNKTIPLNKKCYRTDQNGYECGSLSVNFTDRLLFETSVPNVRTIHYRIKNCLVPPMEYPTWRNLITSRTDSDWHCYDLVFNYDQTQFTLYVDGKEVGDYRDDDYFVIKDCQCCISEMCVFDQPLPYWYMNVIGDYGVYSCREEQSKKFDNTKNSYHPIFATQIPRTCYGRFVTGLPQTIQGGRICSKGINSSTGEIDYIQPLSGKDTYKWNVDLYYQPNDSKEVSMLWSKKAANNIYDRQIIPQFDGNGNVIGTTVEREYHDKIVSDKPQADVFCMRQQKYFVDGVEMYAPANFNCHSFKTINDSFVKREVEVADANKYVPVWWVNTRKDYKASVVETDSTITAVKHYVNDDYPVVNHGGKKTNYFDEGCRFDGSDNGNPKVFCNPLYDRHTQYLLNTGYVTRTKDLCSDNYVLHGHQIDPFTYENKFIENIGDSYHEPKETTLNTNIFYEPNGELITKEMKDNFIYHINLRLDSIEKFKEPIDGVYKPTKQFTRNKDDMNWAYVNIKKLPAYETYKNILNGTSSEFVHKEGPIVYLLTEYVAVPVNDSRTGYFYWQVRANRYAICNSDYSNSNVIYRQKTGFVDNGVPQDVCIVQEVILQTYINNKYVDNKNDDYYDYINQLQTDLCGQKLCNYDPCVIVKLSEETRLGMIDQEIVNPIGFRNYWSLMFKPVLNVVKYPSTKYINDGSEFYLSNKKLYVFVNDGWYGPFKINENDVLNYTMLNKIRDQITSVFIGNMLCVRVQDGLWISVQYETGFVSEIHKLYECFNVGEGFFVNVPFTNPSNGNWDYNMDVPEILTTEFRLRKYNNNGTQQLDRFRSKSFEDNGKKYKMTVGKRWIDNKYDHKAYGNPDRDCTFVDNVNYGVIFHNKVSFATPNNRLVKQRNLKKIDFNNYSSKDIIDKINEIISCIREGTVKKDRIWAKSSYLINNPDLVVLNTTSSYDLTTVKKINQIIDSLQNHTCGCSKQQIDFEYLECIPTISDIDTNLIVDDSDIIQKINQIVMFIQTGNSSYLT